MNTMSRHTRYKTSRNLFIVMSCIYIVLFCFVDVLSGISDDYSFAFRLRIIVTGQCASILEILPNVLMHFAAILASAFLAGWVTQMIVVVVVELLCRKPSA